MGQRANHQPASESGTPELLRKYLSYIGRGKLLTPEEELALTRAAKAGDGKARRRLVEKNLRLVVSVAKKYRGYGLPFEDLDSRVDVTSTALEDVKGLLRVRAQRLRRRLSGRRSRGTVDTAHHARSWRLIAEATVEARKAGGRGRTARN